MSELDVRWQQRFANFCRALDQLERFFEPPALNEREQQGLIKAFEYTFELGWNTLRDLLRSEGNGRADRRQHQGPLLALFLRSAGNTPAAAAERAMTNPTARVRPIPGLPEVASDRLLALLASCPTVEQVWLYGSRAMGRHHQASDIDLTLKGERLQHQDLLQLMARIDDLLLPWKVDLSLYASLDADLRQHVSRVGLLLLDAGAAEAASG